MATLVLGVVGSSAFGPIGGFVGAAAGGLIDQFLLFPTLFPKQNLSGPRLDDLPVTTASEGSPAKWVIGPRNRVGGVVVWESELIEVLTSQRVGKGGGGQRITTYSYFKDIAIHWCDTATTGPVRRVKKIWADSKVIFENGVEGIYAEEITNYDGSQTTASPLIQSYEDVSLVSPMKKSCYSTVKRLALAHFGGSRTPNFTALIEQTTDMSVGEAISQVLVRSGYQASEFDVTRIPSCFKGMIVSGPQSGDQALGAVLSAYAIGVQESSKIVFFPFGAEVEFAVSESQLAAIESGGEDTPRVLRFTDANDYVLPAEVDVRFVSDELDLVQGGERQRRIGHVSDNVVQLDLPITLSSGEANAIAKRVLWTAEAERKRVEFSLPPSFLAVQEGDVVLATVGSEIFRILVNETTRGNNFRLNFVGRLSEKEVYSQVGQSSGTYDPTPPTVAIDTIGYVADLPALIDDHALNAVGLYWFVCAESPTAVWPGARLYSSTSDSSFDERGAASTEAIIGRTLIGLQNGPTWVWDRVGFVDVELYHGSLSTITEDECVSGQNRCAVRTNSGEWEVFGFATATVIGTNQYRLTDLLRGLRGTEYLVADHVVAEAPFVFLRNDATINFYETGLEGLGTNEYYRFPSLGGNVDDYAPSQRQLINGRTKSSLSPTHVIGSYEVNDDVVITWTRRSKRVFWPLSASSGPMTPDEIPETYDIEIRQGGDGAPIIRTVTVVGATSYVYAAAQQTADGVLDVGNTPFNLRIYQRSSEVGRGIPARKIVTP